MNRKLLASTVLGAAIAFTGAAGAHAADGAYPPSQPSASSTKATPHTAPTTTNNNKNNDTQVLDTKTNTTDNSTLPKTGTEWVATAAVGAGLLAGGAGLVVAARRRQTA